MSNFRRVRVRFSTSPIGRPAPSSLVAMAAHILAAADATRSRALLDGGADRFLAGVGARIVGGPLRFARIGSAPVADQHARELGLGYEHLARLRPLIPGDDPAPLEH